MRPLRSTPGWSPALGHWAPGTFQQQEGLCSVPWNYHCHPKHLLSYAFLVPTLLEMVCASKREIEIQQ